MTDTLNLDNYEFNAYTKKFMLNYFGLEDITGIEEIMIEKIRNDAAAKMQLAVVGFLQEMLEDQGGWGNPSETIIDFVTSVVDYEIGSPITFYEKTWLRNFIESKSKYLTDAVEVLQYIVDISDAARDLYVSIDTMNSNIANDEYLDPKALVTSLSSTFDMLSKSIGFVFSKLNISGAALVDMYFSIAIYVLETGANIILDEIKQQNLYTFGISIFPDKGEKIVEIAKGNFAAANLTIEELDDMYNSLNDPNNIKRFNSAFEDYSAWRYQYELIQSLGGETNYNMIINYLKDIEESQPKWYENLWGGIKGFFGWIADGVSDFASGWNSFFQRLGGEVFDKHQAWNEFWGDVGSAVFRAKEALLGNIPQKPTAWNLFWQGYGSYIYDLLNQKSFFENGLTTENYDEIQELITMFDGMKNNTPDAWDIWCEFWQDVGLDLADILSSEQHKQVIGSVLNDILTGTAAKDVILGGAGDDMLYGGLGDDILYGGAGDDYLYGEKGDDRIFGADGNDLLMGNEGDDILDGGAGNDLLWGGSGNDELHGGDGDDVLYGDAGNDKLFGDAGNDELHGGDGNDELFGGDGDDILYGEAGDDYLEGGSGTNYLYGGDGNDTLVSGDGTDYMYGGAGNDYFIGGNGDNYMYGGSGNDRLQGGEGYDYMEGGTGDDILSGGNGYNEMYGQEGNDEIYGGNDNDYIDGGVGNDRLYGGNGNNEIYGREGNDIIYDGDDASYLYGGDGDDHIYAGGGDDYIDGGLGNDYLQGDHGDDTYVFKAGYGIDIAPPIKPCVN